MKRYAKNKNFLPTSYINNMNLAIDKRERRDCILLVILCMILLPNSIYILTGKETKLETKNSIDYKEKSNNLLYKNESLNNYVDLLKEIVECDLSNGNGEVYIEGRDRLSEYINNERIIINTIEEVDKDKFRIQIEER